MELRELREKVLADGRINTPDLELLRQHVYVGGKVHRREADFLVELYKRLPSHTPGVDQFFYQAIKDHILMDGSIDAEETAWLRQMLFADGKIDDAERKFLHQLKGEAKQVGPEFEALFQECMKQPRDQHTSG